MSSGGIARKVNTRGCYDFGRQKKFGPPIASRKRALAKSKDWRVRPLDMPIRNKPSARVFGQLPVRLTVGLFLAIVLDTALQTIWKRAALTLPANAVSDPVAAALGVLKQPLFLAVGSLIVLQMINWLKVLDDADVSFALPITALSYVSVAAISAVWLGEALTPGRIAGVILILAGVYLVSRTDHKTDGAT